MKMNLTRSAMLGVALTSVLAMRAAPFTLPVDIIPTADQAANLIILDANHDRTEWEFDGDCMYYQASWWYDADDWFFVPVTVSSADKTIQLSFQTKAKSERYTERLIVAYGNEATSESMTNQIGDYSISHETYSTYESDIINPVGDGVMYVGFKCASTSDDYAISVANISLYVANAPTPPAPVIVSSGIDYQEYTATLSIPAKTALDTDFDGTLKLLAEADGETTDYVVTPGSEQEVNLTFATTGKKTVTYKLEYVNSEGNTYYSKTVADEVVAKKAPEIYELPCSFAPTQDEFEECMIYDVNEDDYTWELMDGAFSYRYNNWKEANDWLILPPVNPGDASKIKIEFDVRVANPAYTEKFDVCFGTMPEPDGMEVIMQCYDGFTREYATRSVETEIAEPGKNFHVAFHVISPKEQHTVYIKNISITSATPIVGVDDVSVEKRIATAAGAIIISGFEGETASIYTLDGRTIVNTNLADITTIPVEKRIYIVKVGDTVRKINVR